MASELTPVRTGLSYTILVQDVDGWVPVQHYDELDSALENLDVITQIYPRDAYRVIERERYLNGFRVNVVDEYFPDGYVYGPVNEPVSWAEEGF
jgi:hypothetical protein